MKNFKKVISKIVTFLVILGLVAMSIPTTEAASRLTGAKNTLSNIRASGTGAATAGYTESTRDITDNFIIVDTENDIICFNTTTAVTTSTCNGVGDVKADLIAQGGLISGRHYTGDQIAAAIATALAAADGDPDDSYTVTYSEADDRFSIRGDGGNTLNLDLGWATYTGADSAAATLGYTANKADIRDIAAVSDLTVAFNVRTGDNDTFRISVDQETPVPVTIAQGVYTAASLVTEMDAKIDAASTHTVTVSYANNRFRITSNEVGADSAIVITEGPTDFLALIKMNGDVPVDGVEARGIVSANHTITFTLAAPTTAGDTIGITFAPGFGLTGIDFEDVDLADDGVDIPLAASAAGATWGVSVSGQVLTLTSGTGTIGAGSVVVIEIGRNATFGVAGTEQITNPTTVGLHEILIEIKTGTVVKQDAAIAVYIVPDEAVVVQATIDPILSFAIQGGYLLDFGTLEPNAYHKLGGVRAAYGNINLTGVTINADRDTQTVTVRGKVYEFSDDGVASGGNIVVSIVDNENNYLTAAQVASNLYRAINNNDGDLVRANIRDGVSTVVQVMATEAGTVGNTYSLGTTVTGAIVSGATFAGGVTGYNHKSGSIVYASGLDVGNAQTGTNLVVSTNAAGGYVITLQNTDTDGPNNNADGMTNGTAEITEWGTGTYGYGVLASAQSARYGDGTAAIIASVFQGDGTDDLPGRMRITPATLASYVGTVANDNIAVEYNIRIDASQPAGQYSDTITYITTSTY